MDTVRGILIHPEELNENWLKRLEGTGINRLGLHPVGGEYADQSLQRLLQLWESPAFHTLLDTAGRMGVVFEIEMHAMSWLLPRSLFAEKPEWFRMDENGMRTPSFNGCPSNPETLEYIAGRTCELVSRLPVASHRYCYWVDDVLGGRCHCPKCSKLSESDQQALFVNAMLRGARRADPLAVMPYLAYNDCMLPPAVSLDPGVFLEFAPIRRDMEVPIADATNEKNASQIKHLPRLLQLFDPSEAQVLEYWMDNSFFSGWKKPPKPFHLRENVMAEDVAYYRSLGFGAITCFGCYLGDEYTELYGEPPVQRYAEILNQNF